MMMPRISDFKRKTPKTILLGSVIVALVITGVYVWCGSESSPEFRTFPFENAVAVYNVRSKSSLGFLTGPLSREVINVSNDTYRIKQRIGGNLNKVFENNKIKQLRKDEAIIFAPVLRKATKVKEGEISMRDRVLTIFHYRFENREGGEIIDIWIPKKMKVPIKILDNFPSGYLYIELKMTNIKYLS